jgi:mono/diheme cytochrome c family protein
MNRGCVIVLLVTWAVISAVAADAWKLPAETTKFKPDPGAVLAVANCSACHSSDYVSTQPPLARPAWKATVEKMRSKYGAQIATNNVDAIVDYLTSNYGAAAR